MPERTPHLVEDEAIIAMAEAAMLLKNDHEVVLAESGEQAVALFSHAPRIDLALMDIDLGRGMDGSSPTTRFCRNALEYAG